MLLLRLYQCLTWLSTRLIGLASAWNPKARLWWQGRRETDSLLAARLDKQRPIIWMHCASLGEFEQGRPVLEALSAQHPDHQFLLSFFSPSGYEIRKNYPGADVVCYLPADLPIPLARFLDPYPIRLAIFVKYDIWPLLMDSLRRRQIPAVLIAAHFRAGQRYFQPWGGFFRKALFCFEHIFVQDRLSAELLRGIEYRRLSICGDPRIDRVLEIAGQPAELPLIRDFLSGKKAFVAGSTWPADEEVLFPLLGQIQALGWPMILVPHEVDEAHLRSIETRCPLPLLRYSSINNHTPPNPGAILLVDKIGMLASIYQFGAVAYIGGGFGRSIHNILEPAAFGIPVIFGPNHSAFAEAGGFIEAGGAFSIANSRQLETILQQLSSPDTRQRAGQSLHNYLQAHQGATRIITAELENLLTAP